MHPEPVTEHFVTLFDSHFIASGMCLHASLRAQGLPFKLWIIALDRETEEALLSLALPEINVIPLREIETPALLAVKGTRTLVEYFWTLSPFTFQAVFDRDQIPSRVTYLDADLYFFNRFSLILEELDASGKDALLTEHAYDPQYDQTADAGKFCVQFITIKRTICGIEIMKWWQDRCLEWCYNRVEDGKFGDQRYLEQWPMLFGKNVHVLRQQELALAPWNADYFAAQGVRKPVFFHFHGLRIVNNRRIRLSTYYRIGPAAFRWYKGYARALNRQMSLLEKNKIPLVFLNPELGKLRLTKKRHLKLIFKKKTEHWAFRLMSGRWVLSV